MTLLPPTALKENHLVKSKVTQRLRVLVKMVTTAAGEEVILQVPLRMGLLRHRKNPSLPPPKATTINHLPRRSLLQKRNHPLPTRKQQHQQK
jgi:hypothetical protein